MTEPAVEAVSALIVEVPEAEPLVAGWRQVHDPSASVGVPSHVTILFPFVAPAELSPAVLDAIREIAAAQPRFAVRFERVERREDVVWLTVEPEDPFRAMTAAAWARFPTHPPYGGRFGDVVPHLTIGQGDPAAMAAVQRDAERDLAGHLPLAVTVETLSLFVSGGGHWSRTARFALG